MNFELLIIILSSILFTYSIYITIENRILKKRIKKIFIEQKEDQKIDFQYSAQAMTFLDKIINEKFKFHLYTKLMPIYLDNQIPEKKTINEIKEKIYVSVVGGLTTETKRSILSFFTEKGIEIYIHEKIMILMNETDFRSTGKLNEAFKNIKSKNVEQLIP